MGYGVGSHTGKYSMIQVFIANLLDEHLSSLGCVDNQASQISAAEIGTRSRCQLLTTMLRYGRVSEIVPRLPSGYLQSKPLRSP